MKKMVYGILLGLLISLMLFISALGVANKTAEDNKVRISSLEAQVKAINIALEKRDSVVVNVNVEPQTIKIYEKCTDL